MRIIRLITAVLTLVMAATVGYGIVSGGFSEEGRAILDLAWGRVTLIDLYVGLALLGGWIAIRERQPRVVLPWLVAFVVLGNLATALYALLAAARSETVTDFLTGRQPRPSV